MTLTKTQLLMGVFVETQTSEYSPEMDIYYIALACWLSGSFLCGRWAASETLPLHTGFYNISGHTYPLYQYNDTWRYRVPGGPWIYPSWPDLIAHAETENGDPLIEE